MARDVQQQQAGPGLTPAEIEWLAPYLAHLMAPDEHTVQEIAPGVFAHTWLWHPQDAAQQEGGGDGVR